MRPRMKRQRMYQKNSRPQPRACSAMESVCDFPQNCIRRAIFEIQVRLITQDIWQKTESWHSGQPRQGTISKWEVPRSRCLRRTRRRSASFPAERRVSGHKNQLWGNAALLEGDAEKKTEQQVARESPQADLLKVAHHGSATSTIPELLAAVHPRFAVISVGVRNVYGHPRREVLERLEEAHVVTYRTDMDGAVTFYLDGKTVTSQLAAPH